MDDNALQSIDEIEKEMAGLELKYEEQKEVVVEKDTRIDELLKLTKMTRTEQQARRTK
jgi:hypothetical protein